MGGPVDARLNWVLRGRCLRSGLWGSRHGLQYLQLASGWLQCDLEIGMSDLPS